MAVCLPVNSNLQSNSGNSVKLYRVYYLAQVFAHHPWFCGEAYIEVTEPEAKQNSEFSTRSFKSGGGYPVLSHD